jgi:hypothetical protein
MLQILFLSIFRYLHKIVKATFDFILSVYPSTWNNSAPTGQIFMKFDFEYFLKSIEKIQVSLKFDKNDW